MIRIHNRSKKSITQIVNFTVSNQRVYPSHFGSHSFIYGKTWNNFKLSFRYRIKATRWRRSSSVVVLRCIDRCCMPVGCQSLDGPLQCLVRSLVYFFATAPPIWTLSSDHFHVCLIIKCYNTWYGVDPILIVITICYFLNLIRNMFQWNMHLKDLSTRYQTQNEDGRGHWHGYCNEWFYLHQIWRH